MRRWEKDITPVCDTEAPICGNALPARMLCLRIPHADPSMNYADKE